LSFLSNSGNCKGRLSSADGRRNPCSTRTFFLELSPLNMPRICGILWWDSSIIIRKSSGK